MRLMLLLTLISFVRSVDVTTELGAGPLVLISSSHLWAIDNNWHLRAQIFTCPWTLHTGGLFFFLN